MLKKGFTLIELMIVISIIGIVAALVGPVLTASCSKSQTQQMEIVDQQKETPTQNQVKESESGENKAL